MKENKHLTPRYNKKQENQNIGQNNYAKESSEHIKHALVINKEGWFTTYLSYSDICRWIAFNPTSIELNMFTSRTPTITIQCPISSKMSATH